MNRRTFPRVLSLLLIAEALRIRASSPRCPQRLYTSLDSPLIPSLHFAQPLTPLSLRLTNILLCSTTPRRCLPSSMSEIQSPRLPQSSSIDFDAVEPDQDEVSLIARQSYLEWSTYLEKARDQNGISESCINVEGLLGPTPPLPRGWLAYIRKDQVQKLRDGSSKLYLSGRGYWQDVGSSCQLDSKTLEQSLLVGIQEPCQFELLEDGRFQKWPGVTHRSCPVEGNYLAILVFAWAYIFSAKWIELSTTQSTYGEMQYLIPEVEDAADSTLEIDVGQTDCNELEWWRAIVSPGQGWRSTVTFDGIEYQSPWSVFVSGNPGIKVRGSSSLDGLRQKRAPGSEAALDFLVHFCEMYDLLDQCSAALSVAILIPAIQADVNRLPLPKGYPHKQHARNVSKVIWEQAARIPYYMSIGSNPRGVVALLSAPFFNASIACNFVSAWLDPTFQILDPLLRKNECQTFLNVLSMREPCLASIWLGALIIGFEPHIIRTARLGTPIVDLVAAAWTGINLSFITAEPIQRGASNSVRREDECRLLFFLNCLGYEQRPICPWRPFGSIPVDQSALEAQVHSVCGHNFEYQGWRWDYSDASSSLDSGYRRAQSREKRDKVKQTSKCIPIKVSSDIASETATRSIFSWLRGDGWPPAERHIWEHEWIFGDGGSDSPINDIGSEGSSYNSKETISRWILEIEQSATDG